MCEVACAKPVYSFGVISEKPSRKLEDRKHDHYNTTNNIKIDLSNLLAITCK